MGSDSDSIRGRKAASTLESINMLLRLSSVSFVVREEDDELVPDSSSWEDEDDDESSAWSSTSGCKTSWDEPSPFITEDKTQLIVRILMVSVDVIS